MKTGDHARNVEAGSGVGELEGPERLELSGAGLRRQLDHHLASVRADEPTRARGADSRG